MKIGSSIALIVLGAIMSFAIPDALEGINLELIGYILMGAGVLSLLLTLIVSRPRTQRSSSAVHQDIDPATGSRVVRTETLREPGNTPPDLRA